MSGHESNLEESWAIIYSLYLLGYLDFIKINRTIESVLALQDHKWGGFKAGNYEDIHSSSVSVTYAGVFLLDILNATDRLKFPSIKEAGLMLVMIKRIQMMMLHLFFLVTLLKILITLCGVSSSD